MEYRQKKIIQELERIIVDMHWIIETARNIVEEESEWILIHRGKHFIKSLNGDYSIYKNIIIDNQKYLANSKKLLLAYWGDSPEKVIADAV